MRLVRLEAARALAPVPLEALPEATPPAFARAWEELLASERVAAERTEAHVKIAALLGARGETPRAEAAYWDALARDPTHLGAPVNLGDFEARRGRQDVAEAVLRRGVAAHPLEVEAHSALALTLVRQGRAGEVRGPLARAAALRPHELRQGHVQAISLNQMWRSEEVMAVLRAKLDRHPRHRDSLIALATLERDRTNIAQAERRAGPALAINSSDQEAASLLA